MLRDPQGAKVSVPQLVPENKDDSRGTARRTRVAPAIRNRTAARGMSAFILQDGVVDQRYSTYGRDIERLMGTFGYLDVSPFGRNEDPETRVPGGTVMMSDGSEMDVSRRMKEAFLQRIKL